MVLGSPPQFSNYFLNPYLSGTYGYETYKPYDNLFLNSSLLTQDLAAKKEQAGPINDAVGGSILGGDLFNQLFGGEQGSSDSVLAPFGSPIPSSILGGSASGAKPSGESIDQLIAMLEGLKEPPPSEEEPPASDEPLSAGEMASAGDSSELSGVLGSLLQLLGGGGRQQSSASPMDAILGMNPFSGGFNPSFNTGSFGNPFSFMANPMSIFGGLGGSPASGSLMGSNPLPSFSPESGLFSNSPNQNPGFPALATLDPVIRSSLFTETVSPIFGNILANGGIPPFRNQFFL